MNLPTSADVVVVGGGIVGSAAAASIAARGANVILLEKEDEPAREGSGRAQGSLRVQGRHGVEFPLALESLDLWKEAAQDGEFEFIQGGNLYFQTAPEERSVLENLVREAHASGLTDVTLLDAGQVRELMPCATGPFHGAMWSPIDAQAQPPKATRYFAQRATRNGASTAFGVKVTRLLKVGDRITGVDTTAGPIRARAVVVACGVWTPYLAKTAGVKIPLMPVVMSELETAPMPPLFDQTIRAFGFGARQRPDGRVVVSAGLNAKVSHSVSLSDFNGIRYWLPRAMSFRKNIRLQLDIRRVGQQLRARSTMSPQLIPDRSPEPMVDRALVDSSLQRLTNIIPDFSGVNVERYWAGLVDMTPDGLPVIDNSAGPAGLTVITGLCGHGLHLGPVLGEIAADLSLDGTTTRPIEAFRLARYAEGNVGHPEMTI